MKRMLETKRTAAAIAALLGTILPAQAGLLNIATDPLGTATTSNKPNVMFILDDSGSMGRDSMPDYIDDSHNPGASTNPTTAACADAGDDDSGSIGGNPDPCVFGDPPYNSARRQRHLLQPVDLLSAGGERRRHRYGHPEFGEYGGLHPSDGESVHQHEHHGPLRGLSGPGVLHFAGRCRDQR